jgi:hypothetical protein
MSCPHVIQVTGKIGGPIIGGEIAERNGFSKRIKSFSGAGCSWRLPVVPTACGEMATMDRKRRYAPISPLMPPITTGRLAIAMNRDRDHSDQLATI